MANTVTVDLHTQVMTCRICREQAEIPRKLLRDQHALIEAVDEFQHDHRECNEHRAHPEMARLARQFRKGIQREERKVQHPARVLAFAGRKAA